VRFVVAGILQEPVLVAVLHRPIPELHQMVMIDFIHEVPTCPFFKLHRMVSACRVIGDFDSTASALRGL
jgi:hypothetical protein